MPNPSPDPVPRDPTFEKLLGDFEGAARYPDYDDSSNDYDVSADALRAYVAAQAARIAALEARALSPDVVAAARRLATTFLAEAESDESEWSPVADARAVLAALPEPETPHA